MSDISPIRPYAPNKAIVLNFGARGDIATVITVVIFYVMAFGAVTPLNLEWLVALTTV